MYFCDVKTFLKYLVVLTTFIALCNCTHSNKGVTTLWQTLPENVSTIVKTPSFEAFYNSLQGKETPIALAGIAEILNKQPLETFFKPKSNILISLTNTPEENFSIHTRYNDSIIVLDSITNRSIETLTINTKEIKKYTINEQVLYSTLIDSIFILSSSQDILTSITKASSLNEEALFKINNAISDSTAIFSKHLKFPKSKNASSSYWEGYSWKTTNGVFLANGILKSNDSVPFTLSPFATQIAQPITTPQALPVNLESATIFTISDSAKLFNKTSDIPTNAQLFYETIQEICTGKSDSTNFFTVMRSFDTTLSTTNLASSLEEISTYRDVPLYTITNSSIFSKVFNEITALPEVTTLFVYDNFIIATTSISSAENYILNLQTGQTLANKEAYITLQNTISNAASVQYIGIGKEATSILEDNFISPKKDDATTKNILVVKQFVVEKDFSNVVYASIENEVSNIAKIPVTQIAEFEIENTLLGSPVLYNSSNTASTAVILQDINNALQAYSITGKKQWSRKFNNPILGEITPVNLDKNKKQHLAFTTKNAFYVIDTNGKDVAPFPINFKDDVTQPLAVFDYDGNRKYRFVVTQGNEVLMYDSKGKMVKGFTFKKTESDIVFSPKHIRLGNKDYIVIAEKNGTVHLLSRTGKTRINVKEKFKINTSGIQELKLDFTFITTENEQIKISQSGRITKQKLNGAGEHRLLANGKTTVALQDNILTINDKKTELPFGIYTTPQVHNSNNKTYISVTETQENKVYVYDVNGRLLEGFPVYGTAKAILHRDNDNNLLLLTQGTSKQVLVYEIN